MRKRKIIIACLILAVLALVILRLFVQTVPQMKKNLTARELPKWTASQGALVTKSDFKKSLAHYYPAVKNVQITDKFFPVVPGLRGAWSINPKTHKAAFADKWTPQGITTIANKYIVISAYDGNHKLDSLLYLLDQKSGKYLKSIILPNQAHVGGIEYDEQHERLWLSTDNKKSASLSTIQLKNLESYQARVSKQPIRLDHNYPLPWLKATSTLAYSQLDHALIVPYFSKKASALFGLRLNDQGLLDNKIILQTKFKEKNPSNHALMKSGLLNEVYVAKIPAKIQGFAGLGHDYVGVFDSSFGNSSSKMVFNTWDLTLQGNHKIFNFIKLKDEKGKEKSFTLPPYLEQVTSLDNKGLLILFESGSSKYRQKTPYVMDRIVYLSYNEKLLYEQAQKQLAEKGMEIPAY